MTDSDARSLADDLSSLATQASAMTNDPSIQMTDDQAKQVTEAGLSLSQLANDLAQQDALAALTAAAQDFAKMKQATTDANAAVSRGRLQAKKLNAVIAVLGKAISFGQSLTTLPLQGVLSAAEALKSAAGTV